MNKTVLINLNTNHYQLREKLTTLMYQDNGSNIRQYKELDQYKIRIYFELEYINSE